MSIKKLFESVDEKVFTPELKESLETQFNEAVDAKAAIIAEEKITAEIESLNEKSEEHITSLEEKAEEFLEIKKTELVESLDKYLDRIVSDFVSESKTALDESVKSEQAEMIIEAFDTMLTSVGVEVANIVEAKDNSSAENKLEEKVEKYDELVEENIALKDENDNLVKIGVITEMKEDLSIVESEKFEKLANLVDFSKDEVYAEKLQTIKESVKGTKEKEDVLDESDPSQAEKPAWAHLV